MMPATKPARRGEAIPQATILSTTDLAQKVKKSFLEHESWLRDILLEIGSEVEDKFGVVDSDLTDEPSNASIDASPVPCEASPSPLPAVSGGDSLGKPEVQETPGVRNTRRGLRVCDSNVATETPAADASVVLSTRKNVLSSKMNKITAVADSNTCARVNAGGAEMEVDKENREVRDHPPISKRPKRDRGWAGTAATAAVTADTAAAPASAAATAAVSDEKGKPTRAIVTAAASNVRRSARLSHDPSPPCRDSSGGKPRSSDSTITTDNNSGITSNSNQKQESVIAEIAELRAIPISAMKVVDLRAALRRLGASATGRKAILQGKLQEAVEGRLAELQLELVMSTAKITPVTAGGADKTQTDSDGDSAGASNEVNVSGDSSSSGPTGNGSTSTNAAVPLEEGEPGAQARLSVTSEACAAVAPPPMLPSAEALPESASLHPKERGPESDVSPVEGDGDDSMSGSVVGEGEEYVEGDGMDIEVSGDESEQEIDEEEEGSVVESKGAVEGPAGEQGDRDVVAETNDEEQQEEEEEKLKEEGEVPAAADAISVVPVAENVAEIIPAVMSPIPMEQEEGEGGEAGDGSDAVPTAEGSAKGRGKDGSVETDWRVGVEGGAAREQDDDVVEQQNAKRVEPTTVSQLLMDIEESSSPRDEDPESISSSAATEANVSTKPTSGAGFRDNRNDVRAPRCKTPSSSGGVSLSSTSLPSSCGSFSSAPGTGGGAGWGGGSRSDELRVGAKRPLPTPPERDGSSSNSAISSGSDGGGKKQKTGKEKVTLQERMSQLNKVYADKKSKVGTPASQAGAKTGVVSRLPPVAAAKAAAAAATAAAAPLPASTTLAFPPAGPAASTATSAPLLGKKPLAAGAAAGAAASTTASISTGPAGVKPAVAGRTAAPLTASTVSAQHPVADPVKKPANLISTMHSFKSLLTNKKEAAQPALGKWDRLAAGGGATARAVPALRKAEEARALEERRARERTASRLKVHAAGHRTGAAAASTRGEDARAAANGATGRIGVTTVAANAAVVKQAIGSGVSASGSVMDDGGRGVGGSSPPLLAPLRVTGMLAKLVPGAGGQRGVGRVAGSAVLSSSSPSSRAKVAGAAPSVPSKSIVVGAVNLPAPFRPSMDDAAGGPMTMMARGVSDAASVSSCSTSSVTSASTVSVAASGGAVGTAPCSSDKIEKKITDQRAQIEMKRHARMERLKAAEEKKKAELESKELRDAARLEAVRRAKHEAELKARELKAQRQVEVERRREQEWLEKEARDAKERHEKEARRKALVEAKAQQEAAAKAEKAAMLSAKNQESAAVAAATAAAAVAPATTMATSYLANKMPHPAPSSTTQAAAAAAAAASVLKPQVAKPAAVLTSLENLPAPAGSASAQSYLKPSNGEPSKVCASGTGAGGGSVVGEAGAFNSYEMSDHNGESSESESDEEDGEERRRRPGKKIPSWAKGSALSGALAKQYSFDHQLDPDTIFPEVLSCDLEAIFPVNKSKYHRRGSSANWGPDRVTPQEVLMYKRSVGISRAGE